MCGVCDFAQKMCEIAHFYHTPFFVFFLIINQLTFWHDFCSKIIYKKCKIMMKKLIVIAALFLAGKTSAQEETMSLTLEQAIEIAQENSMA